MNLGQGQIACKAPGSGHIWAPCPVAGHGRHRRAPSGADPRRHAWQYPGYSLAYFGPQGHEPDRKGSDVRRMAASRAQTGLTWPRRQVASTFKMRPRPLAEEVVGAMPGGQGVAEGAKCTAISSLGGAERWECAGNRRLRQARASRGKDYTWDGRDSQMPYSGES